MLPNLMSDKILIKDKAAYLLKFGFQPSDLENYNSWDPNTQLSGRDLAKLRRHGDFGFFINIDEKHEDLRRIDECKTFDSTLERLSRECEEVANNAAIARGELADRNVELAESNRKLEKCEQEIKILNFAIKGLEAELVAARRVRDAEDDDPLPGMSKSNKMRRNNQSRYRGRSRSRSPARSPARYRSRSPARFSPERR